MSNKVVSVIMLVYNQENYLPIAINSVLSQKCNFDFELIIGEDCSTDSSRRVILDYQCNYPGIIKLFLPEKNIGALLNEEQCLKLSTGKYIAFLEGDDYWTDPMKLQNQVDFLENNQDYGMVHTDANHYLSQSFKLISAYNKKNNKIFPSGFIFTDYLRGTLFIKTATVLIRKDILDKASDYDLFRKRNWMLTDLPIWLSIAAHTKIKYFDSATATYRLVKESASRSNDLMKQHLFHLSVFDIRYYFWNLYSKDPRIRKTLDTNFCKMMMGDAYKLKNISMAKEAMKRFKQKGICISLKELIKYNIVIACYLLKKA